MRSGASTSDPAWRFAYAGYACYGRALIEIRMSRIMLDRLEVEHACNGAFFKGVLVRVWSTGFDETVEVVFGPARQEAG